MAQSAITVTTPNPTPPTNFGCTGATPPNVPNYTKNTYNDPKNWSSVNPKDFPPPYYDDGSAAALTAFIANVAALASGSGATAGGTENTYPGAGAGSGSPPTTVNNVGAVPASTSVAHEGAGTESVYTAPGSLAYAPTQSVGVGPALSAGVMPTPNQSHASTLSPATNPTLTTIAPTTAASGASGTVALTAVTGVGFNKTSVVYANGVAVPTVFVNSTTLTATMPKKTSAGTWPVTVVTGGVVTTAPQTFTWT